MKMLPEKSVTSYCVQFENEPDKLNDYWDKEFSHTDKIDFALASVIGVLSFSLNEILIGRFSLKEANQWGTEKVNEFVQFAAKKSGYKGDDLKGAISFLENTHPMASDGLTPEFGGGKQHHLRDFTHHCSLFGLFCSLFTQFSGKSIGTDVNGKVILEVIENKKYIGKTISEKIFNGTVEWFLHLVSDMAGSSTAKGKGTGIPGPILSAIKGFSAVLPKSLKIDNTTASQFASKLYNGTLLADRDEKGKIKKGGELPFDLRTELGCFSHFLKQAAWMLVNDTAIVACCVLKQIFGILKKKQVDSIAEFFSLINKNTILPKKTVADMITVSTSVFVGLDTGHALIKGVINSKGTTAWERIITGAVEFAANKNFCADAQLIAAIVVDCKINMHVRDERALFQTKYEQGLSKVFRPAFSFEQTRIIESLKKHAIEQDVLSTEKVHLAQQKQAWLTAWEKETIEEYAPGNDHFFFTKYEIKEKLMSMNKEAPAKLQLMIIEAYFFCPYYHLDNNKIDVIENNTIMQHYLSVLMNDIGIDFEQLIKLNDLQNFAEKILTYKKSIDYREQRITDAKQIGEKTLIAIKILHHPLIFPLFMPKNSLEKISGSLANTIVNRQLNKLSYEETTFYYTCVKVIVLSMILPLQERIALSDRVDIVEKHLTTGINDCVDKKNRQTAERYLSYIKECQEILNQMKGKIELTVCEEND